MEASGFGFAFGPEVPSGKDQTLFDWDQHGWMLWVQKETGLKKLVQTICSHHLMQAGGGWADLAAGSDPYLVHTWPEFQCRLEEL